PLFAKLRRIVLFTSTAPWLYAQAGYEPVNRPDYTWTIGRPDIYKQARRTEK
ncbi:N-acetyltransferase, partial [Kosakonia pseudosacchari]